MIEAHWVGSGMAEVARQDAKDDLVQPVWTGGGSIARTVGRLYASSGVGGGSGACTATIVGGIRAMLRTCGSAQGGDAEGVPSRMIRKVSE